METLHLLVIVMLPVGACVSTIAVFFLCTHFFVDKDKMLRDGGRARQQSGKATKVV